MALAAPGSWRQNLFDSRSRMQNPPTPRLGSGRRRRKQILRVEKRLQGQDRHQIGSPHSDLEAISPFNSACFAGSANYRTRSHDCAALTIAAVGVADDLHCLRGRHNLLGSVGLIPTLTLGMMAGMQVAATWLARPSADQSRQEEVRLEGSAGSGDLLDRDLKDKRKKYREFRENTPLVAEATPKDGAPPPRPVSEN